MAINADDEILQDFLVEAGEILEQLSEQLVELEHRPDDRDLLNAVFRGFHTIKGGASFLSLTALVEICHSAEDLFNMLRQGELIADSTLMDVVLRVLDVLNEMFVELRGGEEPTAAPTELFAALDAIKKGEAAATAVVEVEPLSPVLNAPESVIAIPEASEDVLFSGSGGDDFFDFSADASPVSATATADDITEAEFEALLDQLHGKGKHAGIPQPALPSESSAPAVPAASDEISEDEFESLLDQLHGKGKHGGIPAASVPPSAPATPPPAKETVKPVAKPASEVTAVPPPDAAKASSEQVAPVPVTSVSKAAAPAKPERASASDHDADDSAAKKKDAGAQGETTVRVDTKRLDDIMNLVGELVLVRNRLATLEATRIDEDMAKAVANLDVVTSDLQTAVMKTRMQPIKKVFGRFPRVVRDLARSLKKEVELELRGEETDLDKNLVEALADPLVHLVRNSVDHGIEMPDVRERSGKVRSGRVELAAEQEGDHILLTITDDGGGMDPEVLRRKVVEKGLLDADAASRLDDHDCFQLIFLPGFSTKSEISDISGRGVGMDVVKTRIVQLNGSVEIDSQKGVGTTIRIKVPLTLAIMPTLMVMLKSQIFALPLVNVSEIFHLDLSNTNIVDGQRVVMVREKAMPLFYLTDWLVKGGAVSHTGEGHVVVVTVGSQKVGFVVDQLIGQEEVVIKPLGSMLSGTKGLAGATIRGDGQIALILDVPSLLKAYARKL